LQKLQFLRALSMRDVLTVGLLYPGEMGASFGRVLTAQGHRVITALAARSGRTQRLSREAGIVCLNSLAELADESDVIVSLVSPAAAGQVAGDFCTVAKRSRPGALYVDANSIGPELKLAIAGQLANVSVDFVDGAINGLAKNLTSGGTLFLSGARAGDVAALVGKAMRVSVLGDQVGQAATMKMLLGGLSKGLCALFLELAVMAQRREMLPQMLEACGKIYPGVTTVIDRMLPTYALHAERRATEMRELDRTSRETAMEPCVIDAIRQLHDGLAQIAFNAADGSTVTSLIERVVAEGLLADGVAAGPDEPTAVCE
jgi:3-hydroxyisobutyrate dehydrogenase-like beta-hydroxyacid dehydrogenase